MFNNDWDIMLKDYLVSAEFKSILSYIDFEYSTKVIYPLRDNLFKAFELTSYKAVKVVILGQDPYHGEGEAHGLSFSVQRGTMPPSLRNIYKELESDLGIKSPLHGDLTKWAMEGVLLLNTSLTVVKDCANSHKGVWDSFTDYVIRLLNGREDSIVFILWGNYAKGKKKFLDSSKHLIIESSHPSPLSAYSGFFGSKPFSRTNEFLINNKKEPIDWSIV